LVASANTNFARLHLPVEPLRGDSRSKFFMLTILPAVEVRTIEKLRQEELEEARAVQSLMLPAEVLCAGPIMIAHQFEPVDIVGGDFVDYFSMDNGSVGFYVGDVSGKGLPAAMYAALAVGILRSVHKTDQSPSEILSAFNKRLMSRGGLRRHAAIVYGVFNPHTCEMHLASAGMPGPLYFSANGCRVLDLSGIPPGLFANSEYETLTLKLEPGDSILVCSDGIIEAQNARYDDFGIARLMSVCRENSSASPTELLMRIFSAVHEFTDLIRQHDDMAAVIFHLGS
jgi:sigma-B regulation protein RsbU (phosphoserine phosphatase)